MLAINRWSLLLLSCVVLIPLAARPRAAYGQSIAGGGASETLRLTTGMRTAMDMLVGGIWAGTGTLEGLGTYRSERRFFRTTENAIASTHVMTLGRQILTRDSATIRIRNDGDPTLDMIDERGTIVTSVQRVSKSAGVLVFDDGRSWRATYSDITAKSFVLEFARKRGELWIPYLRTAYTRAPK